MKKYFLPALFCVVTAMGFAQSANDTICYSPDKEAVYKAGLQAMYYKLDSVATKEGLFKLDYETQHVKIYLVISAKGKVLRVVNGGCSLDEKVEQIVWKMFLSLGDFEPGLKNNVPVTSARLFEFNLYPYYGTEFDVRVKLEEVGSSADKDFTHFMNMYVKQIKALAYYPTKYKHDKKDGLVKVEFSFNAKGKPTAFTIIHPDGEEFVSSSLIPLFAVKPIEADYLEMIGKKKRFVATFDFVAFNDGGFMPYNH